MESRRRAARGRRASVLTALGTVFACGPAVGHPPGDTGGPGLTAPPTGAHATGWPDLPHDGSTSTETLDPTTSASGSNTETNTGLPTTATPSTDSGETDTDGADVQDPALLQLRLTELAPNPEGKDGGAGSPEYLEFINAGDEPATLGDALSVHARSWPTRRGDQLGLSGIVLLPGETVVIERYADARDLPVPSVWKTEHGYVAAFRSSAGLRNEDGAALLAVGPLDPDARGGTIVDLAHYGAPRVDPLDAPAPFAAPEHWAGPGAPTPGSGQALCRGPEDTDSADDWFVCSPTPGVPPDPDPENATTTGGVATTGNIVIVEVLANPIGPAAQEKTLEFVELVNAGDEPVNLEGWRIADQASDWDAPGSGTDPLLYAGGDGGCDPALCLAPGERALVVGNAYEGEVGDGLVLETDDTTIADGGLSGVEAVVLLDPDGEDATSSYRIWDDPDAEPNPVMVELAVIRSSPDADDVPGSWSFAEPTPGLP